jgi:hypothetical protein
MNALLEIFLLLAIILVVGLVSSFTNNKREQFQLVKQLVLPAAFIATFILLTLVPDIFPWIQWSGTSGTWFDVVILARSFLLLILPSILMVVTSFYLGTLIASIMLSFTNRKSIEESEAED